LIVVGEYLLGRLDELEYEPTCGLTCEYRQTVLWKFFVEPNLLDYLGQSIFDVDSGRA